MYMINENDHLATWKSYAAKTMQLFSRFPKISTCYNYIIEYKYIPMC